MVQTQSPKQVNADLDTRWKQFLRKQVNSFIKWDLVRFFNDNPHTADTAENIATVVGRDGKVVAVELDGLVKSGMLQQETVSGNNIYRLTDNADTRLLLNDFVIACHNREFRVKAINHVISGMGFKPQSR